MKTIILIILTMCFATAAFAEEPEFKPETTFSVFAGSNGRPIAGGSVLYQGKGIGLFGGERIYGIDYQSGIMSPWSIYYLAIKQEPTDSTLIWMIQNIGLIGQIGVVHTDNLHLGIGAKIKTKMNDNIALEIGWHSYIGAVGGVAITF